MHIKQLTNTEFNNFKEKFPIYSVYQTTEYSFVMNHQNFDSVILGIVDENEHILGASIVLIQNIKRVKYAYAPRGFLIDYKDDNLLKIFTKLLKKYLNQLGIVAIKINPLIIKTIYDKKYNIITKNEYYEKIENKLISLGYKPIKYSTDFEEIKPKFEAIVDLDKPYYLLFKDLNKEFRTKIRSASKNGIQIFKGTNLEHLYALTKKKYPRNLDYFKDCYQYFSRNNQIDFYYTKLNTEEFLKNKNTELQQREKMINYYNEQVLNNKNISLKMEADKAYDKCKKELIEATKLLKKYPDGIITSSALVIKNRDEIFLFMDGYDTKFKSLNSKHLLIWKMIEMYSNQGFKKFNLGGITNPLEKNNKFNGLNQFKLGFHAKAYEYIGDLELVCNSAKYFMIKNVPFQNILKK